VLPWECLLKLSFILLVLCWYFVAMGLSSGLVSVSWYCDAQTFVVKDDQQSVWSVLNASMQGLAARIRARVILLFFVPV